MSRKVGHLVRKDVGKKQSFELKKQKYFTGLGFRTRRAIVLHRAAGLWGKKDGERDWSNVYEHCLLEAARVQVFAEWLELPSRLKSDLVLAAALHDFNKKEEVLSLREAVSRGGSSVDELYEVEERKTKKLREGGFSKRVIYLVGASGGPPETLLEVRRILNKSVLSHEDIAFLIMHYTDAYTRDADWAEPVNALGENDLDRRVRRNKKYGELDRAIIAVRAPHEPLFKGKRTSEVMGELGHEIERRFTSMIFKKAGQGIQPLRLPEVVDEEIKKRITASS